MRFRPLAVAIVFAWLLLSPAGGRASYESLALNARQPLPWFGGSRQGSSFLGKHWLVRGDLAVFLQHPGSNSDVWQDKPVHQRLAALKQPAGLGQLLAPGRRCGSSFKSIRTLESCAGPLAVWTHGCWPGRRGGASFGAGLKPANSEDS